MYKMFTVVTMYGNGLWVRQYPTKAKIQNKINFHRRDAEKTESPMGCGKTHGTEHTVSQRQNPSKN
jgi:hypothetical protein